jgi:hypothetical protein
LALRGTIGAVSLPASLCGCAAACLRGAPTVQTLYGHARNELGRPSSSSPCNLLGLRPPWVSHCSAPSAQLKNRAKPSSASSASSAPALLARWPLARLRFANQVYNRSRSRSLLRRGLPRQAPPPAPHRRHAAAQWLLRGCCVSAVRCGGRAGAKGPSPAKGFTREQQVLRSTIAQWPYGCGRQQQRT